MWPALVDSAGNLERTRYTDTLGYCVALTHYTYDDDGSASTPQVPVPDCSTLPPRSASTPGMYDDAADWGCAQYINAMSAPGTMSDVRLAR